MLETTSRPDITHAYTTPNTHRHTVLNCTRSLPILSFDTLVHATPLILNTFSKVICYFRLIPEVAVMFPFPAIYDLPCLISWLSLGWELYISNIRWKTGFTFIFSTTTTDWLINRWMCPRGVMVRLINCGIVRSEWVRTPVTLLRSLLDKYPWER